MFGSSLFGVSSAARSCGRKGSSLPRRSRSVVGAAEVGRVLHRCGGFSGPPLRSGMVTTGRCPRSVVPALPTANGPPKGGGWPGFKPSSGRLFSNGRGRSPNGRLGCPGHAVKHLSWSLPREFAAPTHRKQRGTDVSANLDLLALELTLFAARRTRDG